MNTHTVIGVGFPFVQKMGVWRCLRTVQRERLAPILLLCLSPNEQHFFLIHFIYKPKNKKVMKKLFFSLVVAMMAATATFAQNTLVATLTHGENVSYFYGAGAFGSAHNAAASGDIITLSGGTFSNVTVTKALTIRGTGIDATTPTSIGDLTINIPQSDSIRFSMEGINCTNTTTLQGSCSTPTFLKCKFNSVSFNKASSIIDATFANCKISSNLNLGSKSTIKMSHCYVHNYNNYSNNNGSKAQFVYCVVRGRLDYFYSSSFINSIICSTYPTNNYALPASVVAMNSLTIGANPYQNMQGSQVDCSSVTSYASVFNSYSGNYSDSQAFDLTDAAKTKYISTDGSTEIGLYGGQSPYTPTPLYPRISKMNVAKQATADGKLSVEIEVNAAQ